MTYTNNVPQGNQTIASTTTPIRNNFAFIQSTLQRDHQFNGNSPGITEGVHLKVSMPNRSLSPSLPATTNGIYFVSSATPYFYDGTTNWQLNPWESVISGTYTPTSTSSFSNIVLLPANKVGIIIFYATAGGTIQTGQFYTDGTQSFGYSNLVRTQGISGSNDYPVELMNVSSAGLNLRGRAQSGYTNIAYTYNIFYRPR